MHPPDSPSAFMKGPKRKRLAKACDACHKSKRRCDGTAPCSNCFYASKQCTYTDASGRPVPAPRPFKPDSRDPQPSSSSSESRFPQSHHIAGSVNQFRLHPPHPSASGSHPYQKDDSDDEYKHSRKRYRTERGHPMSPEDLIIDGPVAGVSMDRPMAVDLDPQLTRELTNLFFTHCHPARMVIHKPTFTTALSHNKVPSHLLLAVCALAAPLSKQPRFKVTTARMAGKVFAQEALSQMFDGAGRLVVEPDLAAAQALCVLQMHDICTKEKNAVWSSRFHELALQIVEGLGVHSPEHPTLTPVPSQEFVQGSIEREAIRRIFWLIHMLDVIASIYFKKPVTFADHELKLRLPVDETSFELGVHSTLPEYLYLPPVRTQYASELGHLMRILSVYAKMEIAVDEGNDEKYAGRSAAALQEAEQKMEHWTRSLPDHLSWSESNLQVQQSMFETSSNTSAWCWCYIHIYHASCALVLHLARQRAQRGPKTELTWAVDRIQQILTMLGDRAKNSILMGSALWSIVRYCKRDDARLRKWAAEYEEASGTKVFELVQDWRGQPSPPQQHLYPLNQAQEPQLQQSQQHQMQQPHSLSHANSYHGPPHHQASNRRLSDVRSAAGGTYSSANSSNSSRSQTQRDDSDGTSYGGSTNHSMKRSPSNSPPISYPYNRTSNLHPSGSAGGPIRTLGMNQHMSSGLPDPSMGTNASSSGSRDPRGGQGSMNMSAVSGATVPSGMGHNSGNLGDSSGYQSQQQQQPQQQSFVGKYGSRETGHHSRWSNFGSGAGSDAVGGTGDSYSDSTGGMNGPGVANEGKLGGSSNGSGTGAVAGGNGTSGQRNFGSLGEGIQSLPSLKASGLLDSWGSTPRNMGSGDVPKQTSNGASQQQQQITSPRRTTPPAPAPSGNMNLAMLANPQQPAMHSTESELRPQGGLAMPVGLQWLANESR